MQEVFYSVDEVANKMDVHPRTVRRYIASGELTAKRVGKKWIIKKEDLTAFINDRNPVVRNHHHGIKEDDLCVFMDSPYHQAGGNLKVCAIMDLGCESKSLVEEIMSRLMAAVNGNEANRCVDAQLQYVYHEKEKKARFVLWAKPKCIEKAMQIIGEYQDGCCE